MSEQARQVTLEEVAAARQELLDSGRDAGPTAIRTHLGNRGSFSTIQKFLRSLQAAPASQEQGSEPAEEETSETLPAVQSAEMTAIVDLVRRAIAAEIEVVQRKSAEALAAAHRDADARVAAVEALCAVEKSRADLAEGEVDRLSEAADQLADQAESLRSERDQLLADLDQQKTKHIEDIQRLEAEHAKVRETLSRTITGLEAEVLKLVVTKDSQQATVAQAETRAKAAEAEAARERQRGDAEAARERARADQERERVEKLNSELVELRVSLAEASAELARLKATRASETAV
jgi:chromosome segregation ATPase